MVQNARGGARQNQMGRKRKQFANKVNPKKFKPNSNFRNTGGAGVGPNMNSIRDQRDFARDYMDFESFDDFSDPAPRSFYPPQQRPINMGPAIPPYPYGEPRPLLPLLPPAPMFGTRRHMPGPGPMHPPHMRRMGHPPMGPPMMGPPRPLLPRHPPVFGHGPGRHFGPPGPPMRPMPMGMRQPMHGPFGRGPPGRGRGGPPFVRGNKRLVVRGPIVKPSNTKKPKKKKVHPTPPQELNDMTKPWITDEIREANAKKVELNKIAKESTTPNPQLWKDFWQMREKVKTMVTAARLEYIGNHPDEDVEKILSKVDETGGAEVNAESTEAQTGNDVSLAVSESTDVQPVASSANISNIQVLNAPVSTDNIAKGSLQAPVKPAVPLTKAAVKALPTPAVVAPQAKPLASSVQVNPVPVAKSTPTQAKPIVGKVNPAVGVARPTAVVQVKPASTPGKPAVAAANSVVAGKPAAAATAKPVVAAKPAAATAKPVVASVKSAAAATKPAVAKPVVVAVKPAVAAVKPAVAAVKPAVAVVSPGVATPAAIVQVVTSVPTTPASVVPTPTATVAQKQIPTTNRGRARGAQGQYNNRGARGGNANNYSTRSTRQTRGYY